MAENEANNPEAVAAPIADQPEGPKFAVQRIYLKDASFESPRSPAVFQGQWQPKINFDIKTKNTKIQDGVFEVVLVLTVEATLDEEPGFIAEVHHAGIFTAKDFEAGELEQLLATVCPTILFPYAREAIDSLVVKGSFPALMLAPINFDALYTQQKLAAQANASGEAPAPGATN
ncbi:MAG: protein-export chaperone SecB [Gammaproteobacteria bacterium]|nr:protein-export chaperone SecB [Gammaproteobacteria bacterium]